MYKRNASSLKASCLYYQLHCGGTMTLCPLEQLLYCSPGWWAIINNIVYDAEMLFNCNNKSQRLSQTMGIFCLSHDIVWQFCTLDWKFRIFLTPKQRWYLCETWYNLFVDIELFVFKYCLKCPVNCWNCHWPEQNGNSCLQCWHVPQETVNTWAAELSKTCSPKSDRELTSRTLLHDFTPCQM